MPGTTLTPVSNKILLKLVPVNDLHVFVAILKRDIRAGRRLFEIDYLYRLYIIFFDQLMFIH